MVPSKALVAAEELPCMARTGLGPMRGYIMLSLDSELG